MERTDQPSSTPARRISLADVRNDAIAPDLAEEFDDEKPTRRLDGPVAAAIGVVCVVVSVFAVVQVLRPLSQGNQYYLILFLALVLPMVFLCFRPQLPVRLTTRVPALRRLDGDRPSPVDWVLAAVSLFVALYPVLPVALGSGGGGFDAFLDRQGSLVGLDVVLGAVLLVLILEACRRATGWILPAICLVFLAYAYYGGLLPQDWEIAHRGLDVRQIINALYNDPSGFYGTPLDVAASYIVLFTLYGAVLDHSGAGDFFVRLSLGAFGRSRSAPGRTVTLTGFLLGTVSGSGAATTVSLGSVTWPLLKKAGYPKEPAGGVLAAAGIGAILSPPTLGAAAFIIAEYLGVSYGQVLVWAIVPSLLYYLGIVLAVEIDARRMRTAEVVVTDVPPFGRTLLRYGYHLASLGVMIGALVAGYSAPRAVLLATLAAFLLSFLDRSRAMTPRRTWRALADGARGVMPVVAICAAAGIITATVTKTGLGLQLASLLVRAAEAIGPNPTSVLLLTAVFAAFAVSLLGLAVPVTASFIISWVVIGPALIEIGVSAPEAAMFIFYYAVLSEVTPPTALAAVAAAAITGGDVMRTMWQTTKYTLPAFLVPLAIVLTPAGENLLLEGGVVGGLVVFACSALAVAALAALTGGWIVGRAAWPERLLLVPAALLLLYLEPVVVAVGAGFAAAAVALHLLRRARSAPDAEPAPAAPTTA